MSEVAPPDYAWLFAQTRAGRARGPHGARALLDEIGSSDRAFQSIRVVGTNGKGSTCAMLEAGLLAAGLSVGCFTSPHLHDYEERIRIGGQQLLPSRTAQFIAWAKVSGCEAAFFELTLALACQVFAEAGVEIAVMEAGVGGVSDATEALSNVAAVVLTNADLDHTSVLGHTIAEIAKDKAGAARAGVPLLTTATGEALQVVQQVAQEVGAPLYTAETHPGLFALPHDPLLGGPHQRLNASLALATLRVLGKDGYGQNLIAHSSQLIAKPEIVLEAALNARHPARLERFVVEGKTVLIDGAHNPHAARALAEAVPYADVLLFGNLARKDTPATLAPLLKVAPVRVFTAPGDLATSPQELATQFQGQAIPDPAEAVAQALAQTPTGGTLLITGSLYLAGTARRFLQSQVDRL